MDKSFNNFIKSNKFEFFGNIHQQIITGIENGNTVYNRFEIDSNIINDYKKYYEQLINFLKTFNLEDILKSGVVEKIRNIIPEKL